MRPSSSSRASFYDAVYQAPFGPVAVVADSNGVSSIRLQPDPAVPVKSRPSPLATTVLDWLDSYFRDAGAQADVPLAAAGSPFQQRVWNALQAIPVGTVRRYGDLATALSSSARAVGGACRDNPLPLLIPCHRVIAARGLGGFMGNAQALEIKKWLLRHEGVL